MTVAARWTGDQGPIALAIGVTTRCDGCIGFHIEALVRLGATRQEVEEVLGMAVYMVGGPSLMYAADAISAFEQFEKAPTLRPDAARLLPAVRSAALEVNRRLAISAASRSFPAPQG
jgi:AhpD family alkylhydroperoxidase